MTDGSRVPAAARRYLYPLSALVQRDVKKRYAGSMLGMAWTVLQPLTLIAVYVVVFGFVLRAPQPGSTVTFVLSLLCGMLPYLAIADAVQRSAFALKEDRTLLEREDFPAEVVPASRVLSASVGEVVGLGIVLVIGLAAGVSLTGWIVLLPFLMVLRIALTLGVSWLVSILAVFIQDLNEILSLLLTAWLFLTPIFYTADQVPRLLRWTLYVNPLHQVVASYRAVLIEGRVPWPESAVLAAAAVGAGVFGLWFFRLAIGRGKDLL